MDSFLVIWSALSLDRFSIVFLTAGLFLILSRFFVVSDGTARLLSHFCVRIMLALPLALVFELLLLIFAWVLVPFAPSASNRIADWSEAKLPDFDWYWRG